MASCNLRIARVLILAAILNEADLIVPPHDIVPVGLEIFLELGIKLEVLTNAHHDVLRRHSWVCLVAALIPFAFAEVESANTKGNIDDCTLLSSSVLQLDAGKLSVLISWHQQDAALRQLFKQITRREAVFLSQVSEGVFFAVDKLELQRCDLKGQLQPLGLQVEQRRCVLDATQLPALIGVVRATRLLHRHWRELQSRELNHACGKVKGCDFAGVVVAPLLGLVVPDCNFDLRSVFRHVDMSGQGEFDLNADVCSNVGRRVGERNVPEALLHGQNRAHGPLHGLLRLLGELIHLEINDAANNKVILNLVRR